ncbi:Alginate lyase precursor [Leclercia adecarboxylata]|uniref:Alginate lyase n=1 Tax=Leclercia adecarboxylata TaxID=83655 RepID=A0A4U9HV33_9ENTR|nr:Alginate lyase precursor [Leclercia adecarboxylata]
MRKWALATLASSWLELKFTPGTSLAGQQTTERWLGQLADRVVQEWDGLPLKSTNNHSYWAAWAVMASAVALDRRDLFAWSLKEYRIAAGQIAATARWQTNNAVASGRWPIIIMPCSRW